MSKVLEFTYILFNKDNSIVIKTINDVSYEEIRSAIYDDVKDTPCNSTFYIGGKRYCLVYDDAFTAYYSDEELKDLINENVTALTGSNEFGSCVVSKLSSIENEYGEFEYDSLSLGDIQEIIEYINKKENER